MKIRLPALLAALSLALPACSAGSTSSTLPIGGGGGQSSLACPTSGTAPAGLATRTGSERRRMATKFAGLGAVPGSIAVTYAIGGSVRRLDAVSQSLRATNVATLRFGALGRVTRIVSVDPSTSGAAMAQLRSLPGVLAVAPVSYRQMMTIVSNDPYYGGFGAPGPYEETATTPGQWDMHVINAEAAWNDVASAPPVVGAGAPIAVVDTGADLTHPELSGGKVTRAECFVSYPAGTSQTTGAYITDTDGHGTNVAGIASGDTDNALGFASAAYDAKLMLYRIFPTAPSGGCDKSSNKSSPQCSTNSADEAAAINDAVAHGAKVINLSLGSSGPCNPSDVEYSAVENAIAQNVVVVAAAGNGDSNGVGLPALDCPAADPGVIAVGASALDDTIPATITEKIASYSNYVQPSNGRFLLAPGGDASSATDSDDLHWIENIYSSTAADLPSGACAPDFESTSSTVDCRILVDGTSQATPHVAGTAALILTVKPNYTPAQVAAALCNSAVSIGDSRQGCGRLDADAAVRYAQTH